MKPAIQNTMQRSGTLAGESVTMTVDVSAMEHIMTLLTDLYSDQELAVIREYSTNAYDAHVEAGNDAPIEISTPGPLSPFFKIKDYGIGLDAEGIRNIYSKYGASTKRDTDKQVGMLGLGCKSALTYAPQFTLIGIKNGVKTVVAISRDERGRGNMEILEQLATDEPNGVEIMIPVTGRNDFNFKAERFFRFWEPGTVLVNGQQPKKPDLTFIKDGVYLADAEFGDWVVMGNVAYPVKSGSLTDSGYYRKYSVVAHVNIGEVHFTPSREALHYTPQTEAKLVEIRSIVKRYAVEAVQREIETVDNAEEAMRLFIKWKNLLSGSYRSTPELDVKWNGHKLNNEFIKLTDTYAYMVGSRGSGTPRVTELEYNWLAGVSLRIVGFPESELAPKHKSKIRAYINGNNIRGYRVVVCKQLPGAPFTDHMDVVHWNDIKSYKAPRVKNADGTKKTVNTWPVAGPNGYVAENTVVDATRPIYYVERNRRQYVPRKPFFLEDDAQIVAVPANRLNSLQKQFPQAKLLNDVLIERAKQALDKLTADDYAKMKLQDSDVQVASWLNESLIEDPEILALIKVAKGSEFSEEYKSLTRINNILQEWGLSTVKPKIDKKVIFEDYPLINNLSWWTLRQIRNGHVELYINAVYHSKKGS